MLKSLNVLFAEDDESWREKIRGILERDGHKVHVVSNYADAHSGFTTAYSDFDLVVVDLRLGINADNRDGVFLLEDAFIKGIPAIVITGHGTRDLIKKADRYEALRFMHKGNFSIEEFKRVIQQVAIVESKGGTTPEEARNLKLLLEKVLAGDV